MARLELTRTGFDGAAWERSALLARLSDIARSADPADQAALFRDVETLARERGFGDVIDGWQPDVAWLRRA